MFQTFLQVEIWHFHVPCSQSQATPTIQLSLIHVEHYSKGDRGVHHTQKTFTTINNMTIIQQYL